MRNPQGPSGSPTTSNRGATREHGGIHRPGGTGRTRGTGGPLGSLGALRTTGSLGRSSATLAASATFLVVYLALFLVSPYEATGYAITNFIALVTPLALAAAGTTLVLLTGGFDLSVGGMVSLANVICATQMIEASSPWSIAALVLLLGAVSGAVNGLLVVFFGLQSLAVSLAIHIVLTGLALVILPAPGGEIPLDWALFIQGTEAGMPFGLLVLIAVAVLWLLLRRTRTGVAIVALGADRTATQLSGVPVRAAEFTAWVLAGLLYAMAGVFLSGTTATGSPSSGTEFLLTAFAAMALGLVSFRGGRGSVIAAMFGAGILMAIPKVLFGLGVADFWVGMCQGAVILIALAGPLTAGLIAARRGTPHTETHHPDPPDQPGQDASRVASSQDSADEHTGRVATEETI